MVILVDLSECIANLQVVLVVVHPMLLGAVNGEATVWALEVNVRRSHVAGTLWLLACWRHSRHLGGMVLRVRAVCMLPHKGSSTAEFGDWGRRKRVEEIILAQSQSRRA